MQGIAVCLEKCASFLMVTMLFFSGILGVNGISTRKEVYSSILSNHDPLGPPPFNVTLDLTLHLQQILQVDTKNQVLKTASVLEVEWTDPTLTWDASAVPSDLTHVTLPASKIWTPSLFVANSVDADMLQGKGDVLIYPNGRVKWNIKTAMTTSCTIDVTYYPFDQLTCILKYAATDPAIRLVIGGNKHFVRLNEFYLSVEWDIIEVPAFLNDNAGPHGNETDITYYITIRRKTHWISQVWPSVTLALLTLVPNLLPNSKILEKLLLLGFNLAGIFVIWRDITAKLPNSGLATPHIYDYLAPLLLFNLVQLVCTCLLSHWTANDSLWTIIRGLFRRHYELSERSGILEENLSLGLSPKLSDLKQTTEHSKWATVAHALIAGLVLIGVLVATGIFLMDHPHWNESIDSARIIQLYTRNN